MLIKNVRFLTSNTEVSKLPESKFPEIAFIGRSNVGKSSLINSFTGIKGLAKVSGKPGKTQTINHFVVNENWYLVDLPGYGYAKVSKTKRSLFHGFITDYFEKRDNLVNTFILIDSRIPPQEIDLDFINWMGESGLPFALAFTKIDKIGQPQAQKNMAVMKKKLLETWEAAPPMFLTSAEKGYGKDHLLAYFDDCIANFEPPIK